MAGVLHFLPDTNNPAAIVAQLAAALAPGSLIAVSHVTADFAPNTVRDGAAAYNARVPLPVYPRSREEIAAILGDLPVQHPGIVPVSQWQPSLRETAPQPVDVHGAVARLPLPAAPAARLSSALSAAPGTGASDGPRSGHGAAADAAVLARCVALFPDHEPSYEPTQGGLRYIARGRSLDIHPSVVMTSNPGSLLATLAGSTRAAAS
ncbi:MAG: SAM-dependent methyltransferase [Actinomycetota bacterium]